MLRRVTPRFDAGTGTAAALYGPQPLSTARCYGQFYGETMHSGCIVEKAPIEIPCNSACRHADSEIGALHRSRSAWTDSSSHSR
jgi:hypothetical protein